MTVAVLSYAADPTQVAIGTSGSTSQVGITFTVSNATNAPVSVQQIVLTLPQGTGATDLLAPGSSFATGSVHSSDSASWTLTPSGNQATLVPVASQGFATISIGGTVQFTLSQITVNDTGAGATAQIGVLEMLYDAGDGDASIPIGKIESGFRIESFQVDQYNVGVGSPVTVSWQVAGALSCAVTAQIIEAAAAPPAQPRARSADTSCPTCSGTLDSGTTLAGSRTCAVEGATVFTLTAQGTGDGGDVTLTSQLLVTVNEPAIDFTVYPLTVALGQSVELHWFAADAGKLLLVDESPPGSTDLTSTPVGTSTVTPTLSTIYTLCAFTHPGDTQPVKEMGFGVAVENPQWTTPLSASGVPSPAYPGDMVTLTWAVANVASCTLTCDQPGFAPQNGLEPAGSMQVALPDPGVANATATFTMTPVEFGTRGDFTASTTQIAITNLPVFTTPLSANPDAGPPGGSTTLSWVVVGADTATITSDPPGDGPVVLTPPVGPIGMTIPQLAIPGPVTYTIAAERDATDGGVALSKAVVQCQGACTVQWCRTGVATQIDCDYLDTLYAEHPNQRIRQVGLVFDPAQGVLTGVQIWYGDATAPDYQFGAAPTSGTTTTMLVVPAGDYLDALAVGFEDVEGDGATQYGMPTAVVLGTNGGVRVVVGGLPPPSSPGGTILEAFAPQGQQAIALTWNIDNGVICGIGLVQCSADYGA